MHTLFIYGSYRKNGSYRFKKYIYLILFQCQLQVLCSVPVPPQFQFPCSVSVPIRSNTVPGTHIQHSPYTYCNNF